MFIVAKRASKMFLAAEAQNVRLGDMRAYDLCIGSRAGVMRYC